MHLTPRSGSGELASANDPDAVPPTRCERLGDPRHRVVIGKRDGSQAGGGCSLYYPLR